MEHESSSHLGSRSFLSTKHKVAGDGGKPSGYEHAHVAIMDVEMQVAQLRELRAEVETLASRVEVGGSISAAALARLIGIFSQPNGKAIMVNAGLVKLCKDLMSREETSDEIRGLAGSLLT